MRRSSLFGLAALLLVLGRSVAACGHDFDAFEAVPDADIADAPSPVPTATATGSDPGDAGPPDAASDGPSDAGADACAVHDACLAARKTCVDACDATNKTCVKACPDGGAGAGCRTKCGVDQLNCDNACINTCRTCAGTCSHDCTTG